MNPGEPGNDFERRAREHFERETQSLGADTERSLRLARHRALDVADARRRVWRRWVPAGALAAGVALIAMFSVLRSEQIEQQPAPLIVDLGLMTAEDDMELLEELDFYAWLAEQEDVI